MKLKIIVQLVILIVGLVLAMSAVGFSRQFTGNGIGGTPAYQNIWNSR